jgi:hypothetical protein
MTPEDIRVAQKIMGILTEAHLIFHTTADELIDICTTIEQLEIILDHYWSTPTAPIAFAEVALCLAEFLGFLKTDTEGYFVLRWGKLVIPLNSMPESAMNCLLRWLWARPVDLKVRKECVKLMVRYGIYPDSPIVFKMLESVVEPWMSRSSPSTAIDQEGMEYKNMVKHLHKLYVPDPARQRLPENVRRTIYRDF